MMLSRLLLVVTFTSAASFGQSFEVASIRPAPALPAQGADVALHGGPGTNDPTHISWNYVQLKTLVDVAFGVRGYQVSGPGFLDSQSFNITASLPDGATRDQLPMMWRNLLIERFGMKFKVEQREFNGLNLTVAKGGPNLRATQLSEADRASKPTVENGELRGPAIVTFNSMSGGVQTTRVVGHAQKVSALISLLTTELREPVVDHTDLTGVYDFEFSYAPRAVRTQTADSGPDIVEALTQALGLQVSRAKVMLDYIKVEDIRRTPTEN